MSVKRFLTGERSVGAPTAHTPGVVSDARPPSQLANGRRRRGRPVAALTAAVTVTSGIALLGLVGDPAASAATLTVNPSCGSNGTSIDCSQTFTSSGSFSLSQLPGWQIGTPVEFVAVGGDGGASGGGTAGGTGGAVSYSYTPSTLATVSIALGGNASKAEGLYSGSGGAGGGPGGSGAGGNGGEGSGPAEFIAHVTGDGGGGGGGATGVYAAPGFSAPAQTAANLIALAPGGGGSADGAVGGTGGQPGTGGGNCGGGAGTGTSGGTANCQGDPVSGSSGSGGAGGNTQAIMGDAYSSLTGMAGAINGGGGGGGGVYGGGGGGVDYIGVFDQNWSGSGGGGGATLSPPNSEIDYAADSVTAIWDIPTTTTTAVSLSPPTVNTAGSYTVTAQVQPTVPGVTFDPNAIAAASGGPLSADVNFYVDGVRQYWQPLTGNTASASLSAAALSTGDHTITAVFSDGNLTSSGSATLDVVTTPSIGLAISGATGSVNGTPSVPEGADATVTATLPADATGTVTFNDADDTATAQTEPVVNGQASAVIDTAGYPVGTDYITAIYNSTSSVYTDAGTATSASLVIVPALAPAQPVLGSGNSVWTFAKDGAAGTQLLEVNNNSTSDGGAVDTWQPVSDGNATQANEAWVFEPSAPGATAQAGYGWLVNQNSGLCLEVNASTGAVDQWQCVQGAANELWQEVANPAGGDSLQVQSSGQFLATTSANGPRCPPVTAIPWPCRPARTPTAPSPPPPTTRWGRPGRCGASPRPERRPPNS